jgi:shikimate kinase / 3-dehydroquinate synthase
MGAGKSRLGAEVAERLGRPFRDIDTDLEESNGSTVAQLFEEAGEERFRVLEAAMTSRALGDPRLSVIALGGGAVTTPEVRELLRDQAFTVLVDVEVEVAWQRARNTDRPLARDEGEFRRLYDEREPFYAGVANAVASNADEAVLAAGGVHVEPGAFARLPELVPAPAELVSDERVLELHPPSLDVLAHLVPRGEDAKTIGTVERLWRELRLDRSGTLVAFGGGCVSDVAGFAAATYMRGIDWVAVPTTLVGQVDAAIGGKTAINLAEGKNLVGAFHWPKLVVIDPELLATLPEEHRREGMAEVVKTGLLAGTPFWELPDEELVRRAAAFKTAICLRDPHDRGPRQTLNLGHTFAHALEAAADYDAVPHGRAVALGLLAALRLSGRSTDAVEEMLAPEPVRVDRDRAWEALQRDKKSIGDELTLVLLGAGGAYTTQVDPTDVRRALDELIAD